MSKLKINEMLYSGVRMGYTVDMTRHAIVGRLLNVPAVIEWTVVDAISAWPSGIQKVHDWIAENREHPVYGHCVGLACDYGWELELCGRYQADTPNSCELSAIKRWDDGSWVKAYQKTLSGVVLETSRGDVVTMKSPSYRDVCRMVGLLVNSRASC